MGEELAAHELGFNCIVNVWVFLTELTIPQSLRLFGMTYCICHPKASYGTEGSVTQI